MGPPWLRDSSSSAELLQKIVQVSDICCDALKYDDLSRSQVEQLMFTMLDTYKSLLVEEKTVDPVYISTIFHRCASFAKKVHLESKVVKKRWSFLSQLLKVLQKQVDSLKPRTLATIMWSLGCFGPGIKEEALGGGLTVADFLHQIAVVCEIVAPEFHPIQYSGTLVGLANLDHRNERWISALCIELNAKLVSCGPRESANIAWAIGKLECRECCATIEQLGEKALHRFHLFTPQGLSNLVWGGARVRASFSTAFLEGFAEHVLRNSSDMKPQDLSNIVWSFAKLKFYPGKSFLSGIAPIVVKTIGRFKAQEVTNLLYACAIFGEAPSDILSAASTYMTSKQNRFSLEELINCGWALAILGSLRGQQFNVMVARILRNSSIGLDRSSRMGIHMSPNIRDNDLNQLYQCLLYLRYFCPEEEFSIPSELEDASHHSWIDLNLRRPINYTVPKIIDVLESVQYDCKTPKLLTSAGIIINEIKIGDQSVGVEVVRPSNCFVNCPTKYQGPIIWRHQLLRHLQVEPLVIHESVWMKIHHEDQANFLEDNLLVLRDLGSL